MTPTTDTVVPPATGTSAAAAPGRRSPSPRRHRWLVAAGVLLGVVILVRTFVLGWYPVTSASMSPTVRPGDRLLVDKLTPHFAGPDRGDLVTFSSPNDGQLLVKRVVALPGDTVRMDDAVLVVNGHRVREPYVDHRSIDGTYFGPVTVPPHHLYVLGDNRFGSIDSRVYGAIDASSVNGRVLRVMP
jgi:signal peptidase I